MLVFLSEKIKKCIITKTTYDIYRKDFMKDMHLLAAIRDVNVARIIALVEEEPMGAVFEYGELGDLPTFMKSSSENGNDEFTLRYNMKSNICDSYHIYTDSLYYNILLPSF